MNPELLTIFLTFGLGFGACVVLVSLTLASREVRVFWRNYWVLQARRTSNDGKLDPDRLP